MEFLLYIVPGACAGVLAGLFGVDGSLIIVPALVFSFTAHGFGGDALIQMAVGISLATIVFTSINSILEHHRRGAVRWPVFAWMTLGVLISSALGALTAAQIKGPLLQKIVGVFVILVALQVVLNLEPKGSREAPGKGGLTLTGVVIGWALAIPGIGGGSLTMPFLSWRNVPMQQAVATSSICGLPIAISDALSFIAVGWHNLQLLEWSLGYAYLPALVGIAATSTLFARFGARLAHRLSPRVLKQLLALLLFSVGISFLTPDPAFLSQELSILTYPQIDPVALAIGPLKIHWYGLMYLIGIGGAWPLASRRMKRFDPTQTKERLSGLVFWVACGVILGGRLGCVLFYNLDEYTANPTLVLEVWKGSMSFHDGLPGVMPAAWWFGKRHDKGFFQLMDFIAPLVPIGLGAGYIGNFINSELWGKVSDAPWAIVFPNDGPLPRHLSQLYQFAPEGVALFVIPWLFTRKPWPTASVSGLFVLCYGIFRFVVEFVRVPDAQLGYLAWDWLTMDQVLCVPMVLADTALMVWAYRRNAAQPRTARAAFCARGG